MHAFGCLISSRYVWAGLIKEVSDWACNCLDCQGAKVICRAYIRLQHIPIPTMRFRQIHVDLIGFLVKSLGFTHLFTIIDGTRRRAEPIPLKLTSKVACTAFFRGWTSLFGIPAVITSDKRTQFTSTIWAALVKLLGIYHSVVTAYHLEANGMVEYFHHRRKDSLHACYATNTTAICFPPQSRGHTM